MNARRITATQFKSRCLRLLDEVAESGETLVVTKRGRPVARVEAIGPPADLRGSATVHVSEQELIHATMGEWDMQRS